MYCTKYIAGIFYITHFADAKVFRTGKKVNENGDIVTAGSRVLCVTAPGDTFGEAQAKALKLCRKVTLMVFSTLKILFTVQLLIKILIFN